MDFILRVILTFVLGGILGGAVVFLITYIKSNGLAQKAEKLLEETKKEAEKLKRDRLLEIKEESYKLKQEVDKEIKEKKDELKDSESRILQRENNFDKRDIILQKR